MALDVMGNSRNIGLDLAVWHQAEVVPRLLAVPFAAAVLTGIQQLENCSPRNSGECGTPCSLGYMVLWFIVALYFCVAYYCMGRIKAFA